MYLWKKWKTNNIKGLKQNIKIGMNENNASERIRDGVYEREGRRDIEREMCVKLYTMYHTNTSMICTYFFYKALVPVIVLLSYHSYRPVWNLKFLETSQIYSFEISEIVTHSILEE